MFFNRKKNRQKEKISFIKNNDGLLEELKEKGISNKNILKAKPVVISALEMHAVTKNNIKKYAIAINEVSLLRQSRQAAALKIENKEGYYLRMSVKGGGCSGMTYKMSFDNQQEEFDKVFESEGLKIVCDLQSWLYLKGTNIEYSDDMLNGGFKINNPNAERTCGCGTSFSV